MKRSVSDFAVRCSLGRLSLQCFLASEMCAVIPDVGAGFLEPALQCFRSDRGSLGKLEPVAGRHRFIGSGAPFLVLFSWDDHLTAIRRYAVK